MIYLNLSQSELCDLLRAYDTYVYKALEADLFKKGWVPNDVALFYSEEYLTVWKNRGESENADYDCWNYMHSYNSEDGEEDAQ